MWRAGDLRELAHAHEIHVTTRDSAKSLLQKLGDHHCTTTCPTLITVFTTRSTPRSHVSKKPEHIPSLHPPQHPGSFLRIASESMRNAWIKEWQDIMTTEEFRHDVCAACARRLRRQDVQRVEIHSIDLTLLRNDELPPQVYPRNYNFELYRRALLEPAGMTDPWNLAPLHMCSTCARELMAKHRMPKLSLANWLYYGHDTLPASVSRAIHDSTQFDRLLVSRARGSRISFRFTELREKDTDRPRSRWPKEDDPFVSQRCIKGNILVMPQNTTQLHTVLPPSPSAIRDTVCAVFIGRTKPTKETIGRLGPVLVRKSRVKAIAEFLCAENPYYACDSTFHGVSEQNLDSLFGPDTANLDEGVPCSMEIAHIEHTDVIDSLTSDYTGRDRDEEDDAKGDILMENVGYTCGEDRPVSYRDMKFRALSHCLNGGRFIQSSAGERFVPDFENPALLTWMFPHLDPWGIGGFHHPNRTVPISMQEQLGYLMSIHDGRFQADPDFAFVYYNILQKKAVCDSVRFRVRASQQRDIVHRLLSVDRALLEKLTANYDRDPMYEPSTVEERNLLHLMNSVEAVLRNLPGTSGYKLNMRNEIRSLVYYRGTPAFFVTLNPSDIHHPLVSLLAGENVCLEAPETGEQLNEWRRKLTVARNPAACAKFFHIMISNFIDIILRYGRPGGGLFG
ncbi:hypothetical protein C8Q76DRAFT_627348, partial [Earliella scabrosa]